MENQETEAINECVQQAKSSIFMLIVQNYNIIIVDGEIGRLNAGLTLSKKGHHVTILEAASQLGEAHSVVAKTDPQVGAGI